MNFLTWMKNASIEDYTFIRFRIPHFFHRGLIRIIHVECEKKIWVVSKKETPLKSVSRRCRKILEILQARVFASCQLFIPCSDRLANIIKRSEGFQFWGSRVEMLETLWILKLCLSRISNNKANCIPKYRFSWHACAHEAILTWYCSHRNLHTIARDVKRKQRKIYERIRDFN